MTESHLDIRVVEPFGMPDAPFTTHEAPFPVARGDDWAVLYKPCGMHSVGPGPSLQAWAASFFADARLTGRSVRESGMLSRLDSATSGLVLFATSDEGYERLRRAGVAGQLRKTYLARATPDGAGFAGSIPRLMVAHAGLDGELLPSVIASWFRSYGPGGAAVACIAPDRRDECKKPLAPSLYRTEIVAMKRIGEIIEVEAALRAGFRHQIRAHLAWCGCPILGDTKYGGKAAPRLYLESRGIEFPDASGRTICVDLRDGAAT